MCHLSTFRYSPLKPRKNKQKAKAHFYSLLCQIDTENYTFAVEN